MKQYTLRGIPREIEKMVEAEARKTGLSVNRSVISLLEKALLGGGAGREAKKLHKDLDALFNVWSERESDRFEESLKLQRRVDEGLWKDEG